MTHMPSAKQPNPMPTSREKLLAPALAADVMPAMKRIIPVARHIAESNAQMIIDFLDDIVSLILRMDSWNSSCRMMPCRCTG